MIAVSAHAVHISRSAFLTARSEHDPVRRFRRA